MKRKERKRKMKEWDNERKKDIVDKREERKGEEKKKEERIEWKEKERGRSKKEGRLGDGVDGEREGEKHRRKEN